MRRRDLLTFAGAGAVGAIAFAVPKWNRTPAIFVPCFDVYVTTITEGETMMDAHGIVSTFFVYFETLDTSSSYPTTAQLKKFRSKGHEIGAYSGGYDDGTPSGCDLRQLSQKTKKINGVDVNIGLRLARDRLLAIKASAVAKGFNPESLAPYRRAWSEPLGYITEGIFENVRAVDDHVLQPLPVPNRHYVSKGGAPSLDNADTAETIIAQIENLCVNGGIYFMVIHQIGVDSDPNYSVQNHPLMQASHMPARKSTRAGCST
jgi:hypothetical protein